MSKLLLAFVIAVSTFAQTGSPDAVRKVVDIKHISGERATRAVQLVKAYMHPVGSVEFEPTLKAAVLIGPEKVVAGAEALLAKFDSPNAVRPESQIEFRVHLVEGLADPAGSGPIPADIASAVEQMKKSFAYKGYRLLDTVLLRARSSQEAARTDGMLPGTPNFRMRPGYDLSYDNANVLEDGKTVAIRRFTFQLRVPILDTKGNEQWGPSTIRADLTIQEGQKLVVGKLSSHESQNAVFLILTVDVQ